MLNKAELDAVVKALSDEWGEEAVATDPDENKAYIQFIGDVVITHTIDCNLCVAHGVADMPNGFPPDNSIKGVEKLCVYANRLNVTLSRELGVAHCFHVVDGNLKLTDTRLFSGPEEIVLICDAQARDLLSIVGVVTQTHLPQARERDDHNADVPDNAVYV